MTKKIISILLVFLLLCTSGCKKNPQQPIQTTSVSSQVSEVSEEIEESTEVSITETLISEDGIYTSKEDVCAYLLEYNHLPDNYIKKSEAQALGWDSKKGNLNEVAPGKSIGGDKFGNYEKILPENKYFECDIDYIEGYRNEKRIIFSKDGHIYYTADHYETFEELAPEEGVIWK